MHSERLEVVDQVVGKGAWRSRDLSWVAAWRLGARDPNFSFDTRPAATGAGTDEIDDSLG